MTSIKLKRNKFITDKKKYFFTQCIISLLNSLQQAIIMPKSLVGFKKDYTLIWIMRAPRDTLDRIKMVGGGDV